MGWLLDETIGRPGLPGFCIILIGMKFFFVNGMRETTSLIPGST